MANWINTDHYTKFCFFTRVQNYRTEYMCERKIDRQVKSNQKCKHHTTPHHTTSTLLLFFSFFSSSSQFFLLLPSASTGSKGKRCKQNQHHLGTYHAHNVDCQLKFLLPFAGEGEKELRMAPIPHPGSAQNTNTLEENGTVALKHQYS